RSLILTQRITKLHLAAEICTQQEQLSPGCWGHCGRCVGAEQSQWSAIPSDRAKGSLRPEEGGQ
ncbi:MAG: hypothetical protein AAGK05_08835, partial [Pseudomonadota bacterium]